jgi:FADH2 O2-dependent halogenase
MSDPVFDVAIVGSGFAGSITATLLSKLGYSTLLLEKGKHPRFALGESSTPVTTYYFERFARLFDIPEFVQLSGYDRMKADPSKLNCGPKELFYYLYHRLDAPVRRFEALDPEIALQVRGVDLQYDRAALDEYLMRVACKYGATYIDDVDVTTLDIRDDGVELVCVKQGETIRHRARFLIDGTGNHSVLSQALNLRVSPADLDTPLASRTIFTHYRGVKNLNAVFPGGCPNERLPIDRQRSTQHHVFDGGWYWFIPFDSGVTSVGVSLDLDRYPENSVAAEQEFLEITRRLPVVADMLGNAERVLPWFKSRRLQYLSKEFAGDRWALLPAAAFGMDAWQSTGLTLSMMGIDRLVWALDNVVFRFNAFSKESLRSYAKPLRQEYHDVSRFVHGVYKSFRHYDIFRLFCLMPALSVEPFALDGGLNRPWDENALFMFFGNPHWRTAFYRLYDVVLACATRERVDPEVVRGMQSFIVNDLKRYNNRDYGDPAARNIHMRRGENDRALDDALRFDR